MGVVYMVQERERAAAEAAAAEAARKAQSAAEAEREEESKTAGIGYDPDANDITDPDKATPEMPPELPTVSLPGWGELTIEADRLQVTGVNLFNPSGNEGKYDLTFEISADIDGDGNKELLYKSGRVAPGKTITGITLTQAVPAGDYEADVLIQPYFIGDDTPVNNGIARIPLHAVSGS